MRTQRLAVFAALAALGITSTAAAQTPPTPTRITRQHVSHHSTRRVCRHRNKHHRLVRVRCPAKHKPRAHANTPAPVPTVSTPVAAAPSVIGVGHTPGCVDGADPIPYLRQYGANSMRVIVSPEVGDHGKALGCIEAAHNAGYKVLLSIQWWNHMTDDQIVQEYQQMLAAYAPYVYAVAVGNEQELVQGGWFAKDTGAQYAQVWQAVEPVIAQMAPKAVRVAGEITPWGLGFLSDAMKAGLPGVQAIAAHPYQMPFGAPVSAFVLAAAKWHLPIWFTEGLAAPNAWGGVQDVPLAGMAGAVAGFVWMR